REPGGLHRPRAAAAPRGALPGRDAGADAVRGGGDHRPARRLPLRARGGLSAAMDPGGGLRGLLTGLEPFGGEPVNPSELLVTELAGRPGAVPGVMLLAAVLPVDRTRVASTLDALLARCRPDTVLSVGQATGRARVDLETVARNAIDFRGERDN